MTGTPNGEQTSRRAWTDGELRALPSRVDLVTACQIAYGCGKNKAWELYHGGELDFPALRVGRRVVCPVRPILDLLGIDREGTASEAA
jgi:hypothetical protein